MAKLKVGILGATGMVGQQYVSLLEGHPWFEVFWLGASEKSAGKTYEEAVKGRWHMKNPVPEGVKDLVVGNAANLPEADFVFSALDSSTAREYEELYARKMPVVSNASTHRYDPDVPMLIPEINHSHTDIIPIQKENRGWNGFIAVKPNCSLQSYMTPVYALKCFGIKKIIVTTLQSVSGSGYPGISSFDITDNVIPFIDGEEEKSEKEPLKILGKIEGNIIASANGIKVSAHCNRVGVIDGHLACVSVEFEKKPSRHEILDAWNNFRSLPQELDLPFAPKKPIHYTEEKDRPQPRLDRDNDKGMAVTVGRLRECNVLDYRFVGLSHNTVRGAAGGGILNAELLYAKGYLK